MAIEGNEWQCNIDFWVFNEEDKGRHITNEGYC